MPLLKLDPPESVAFKTIFIEELDVALVTLALTIGFVVSYDVVKLLEQAVFPTASFTQKYHVLDDETVLVFVTVDVEAGFTSLQPDVGVVLEFVN